jgi:ubiquinone biosynthesis protein UbiJ
VSTAAAAVGALELLINRYLAMDPYAMEQLAELHGQVICIEVVGLQLRLFMVPGPSGIQVLSRFEEEPDCTLRGTPLALARMRNSETKTDQLLAGNVEVVGNTELGHRFGEILSGLDIDWEEQLSRFTGDPLAHEIGRGVRGIKNWGGQTLRTWGTNLQEYLQEELRLLPSRLEIEDFLDDVDQYRDDVERMQARVERLHQQLNPPENPRSSH